MAFPASQGTLASSLQEASNIAVRLKGLAQQVRTASAAGDTGRSIYLTLQARLAEGAARWAQIGAVPGIAAYAQEQYGNGSLDVVAEFTTMRNAVLALRDWIFNNFPKDGGSSAALVFVYNVDGVPSELTFTSVQTIQFRVEADAFIATVS